MAEKQVEKGDTGKSHTGSVSAGSSAFTLEERAAMKERAAELKTTRRGGKTDGNSDVLTKIAEMPEPDRLMAERVHEIVRAAAPGLAPRT